MKIKALRILPPFAIGRLGSSPTPLDNYDLEDNYTFEDDPSIVGRDKELKVTHPLDYRKITPKPTFIVDEKSGAILARTPTPEVIVFKDPRDKETKEKIRPVAPFLEVWVETEDGLEPLTRKILAKLELTPDDIKWSVTVANRKVERRTSDEDDRVVAETGWFSDHQRQRLKGECKNFVRGKSIDFGDVRYIKPTAQFPEIRLRFTPAQGQIYGPDLSKLLTAEDQKAAEAGAAKHPPKASDVYELPDANKVYDPSLGEWYGYEVPVVTDDQRPERTSKKGKMLAHETMPPALFAISGPAPTWLHDNVARSRGYFDDACDGLVEVRLKPKKGSVLKAAARICSGPPAMVPDTLFLRNLADDLDQVLHGPTVPADEDPAHTRERALDIVRRAFETVGFLNVAVMNGNPMMGRDPLLFDTMPAEEAFGVQRSMRPVVPERTADTLAIKALHQQVYAALRGGAAPWFGRLLRQPGSAADYTDHGRRQMPAMMCGADGNYLALTYRQINTIFRAAGLHIDPEMESLAETTPATGGKPEKKTGKKQKVGDVLQRGALTPRNLAAQLHYVAAGNPHCTRPVFAVANCTPGLEVDFRAAWSRIFKGIVLREWDNLVVDMEKDAKLKDTAKNKAALAGHRLLCVEYVKVTDSTHKDGKTVPHLKFYQDPMVTTMIGPSPADPKSRSTVLATDANPYGVAPLEWSNALARTLNLCAGKKEKVRCYFTQEPVWLKQSPWVRTGAECFLDENAARERAGFEPKDPPEYEAEDPRKQEWAAELASAKKERAAPRYLVVELEVRPLFEPGTALVALELAQPGELTQGLCSPWQNDYRECSCYYWASARPDFVNVEMSSSGASIGDNWLQKRRTGDYVPDDYVDSRLINYEDLFRDWEKYLRFQIGGRDSNTSK